MCNKFVGGMLNYYMGTGKTLISVALYLVYRRLAYERGLDVTPAFVVVPPTLVVQWIKEITSHTYLTEHAICKYKEKSSASTFRSKISASSSR